MYTATLPASRSAGQAQAAGSLTPGSAAALLGLASTDAERYGVLVELWKAALSEARRSPVCDWCSEPVVKAEQGWCHRSGFYSCETLPLRYAQVDGTSAVAS